MEPDFVCCYGRVRGDLSQSKERVRSLELSHAQQRLDWEGRAREAERVAYSKQEQALKDLSETKREVSGRISESSVNLECLEAEY